jgi:hypothetical protein
MRESKGGGLLELAVIRQDANLFGKATAFLRSLSDERLEAVRANAVLMLQESKMALQAIEGEVRRRGRRRAKP